jgi:catalase
VQAGMLYRLMRADERERLVQNIAGSLARVSREEIVARSIGHFRNADPEYGARVEQAVKARRGR